MKILAALPRIVAGVWAARPRRARRSDPELTPIQVWDVVAVCAVGVLVLSHADLRLAAGFVLLLLLVARAGVVAAHVRQQVQARGRRGGAQYP